MEKDQIDPKLLFTRRYDGSEWYVTYDKLSEGLFIQPVPTFDPAQEAKKEAPEPQGDPQGKFNAALKHGI